VECSVWRSRLDHKHTIVVADDHPVFRQGLRQIIEAEPDFKILGEAGDGKQALDLVRRLKPTVAILDIAMPEQDGLSVVRSIRKQNLLVEVIFLTMYRDESIFKSALDLDVKGYVLKDSVPTDIVSGIRAVCRGEHYTSPLLTSYLVKMRTAVSPHSEPPPSALTELSLSERRVLDLIADYKTSKEIADELCVSPRTIESHRAHICQKLGLQGSHALMKFALQHKSSSLSTSTEENQ
jgi:DNA-binding NarL/FixJ family response regulator